MNLSLMNGILPWLMFISQFILSHISAVESQAIGANTPSQEHAIKSHNRGDLLLEPKEANVDHPSKYALHQHSGTVDDEFHECYRRCHPHTAPKICHYHFQIEWYVTMSKACMDCPYNLTDCALPHCVPADGFKRPIVTTNRRMPGPSIEVCEGDQIVVDVENLLVSDTTTIHWHGLHQKGTPYMDGVPLLTQCPISPGSTFRYHFIADNPGTHYWHSHSGFQRADGVFGNLIIRSKEDKHKSQYDVDDPKHTIFLTDWMDALAVDKFVNHHHSEHENKPYNILVNGLGKYQPFEKEGKTIYTPLAEFRVKKGLRYRFRAISNAIQNCPIEMSVDNHTLLVIASDGSEIVPVKVESLVIYAGERWDFILSTNQETNSYWMKFRGLLDCDERFLSVYQVSVLRYEGSPDIPEPVENLSYEKSRRKGLQLNKLNVAPGDFKTFMTAADVRGYRTKYQKEQYARTPDHKFWLDFDFYGRDNYLFHNEELYPFYGVETKKRIFLPQINNISFMFPSSPPLSQPENFREDQICNASSRPDCEKFCHCVHTLKVELGELVELILVDKGVTYYANHPFHLHGHLFAVHAMNDFGENTTLEMVKNLEQEGKLHRNFDNPPMKDSVTVPDGGYTVLRFIADNPGYWIFHCHLTFHVEVGMGLIFHIGSPHHIPPVPKGFPKCGSWTPRPSDTLRESIQSWKENTILDGGDFVNQSKNVYYLEENNDGSGGVASVVEGNLILAWASLLLLTVHL